MLRLDPKFWNGQRWNGHDAFDTIDHRHVSCYSSTEGHDDCEIMIVRCRDGRWYVEDTWGGDAKGAEGVWNPFDPSDIGPFFHSTEEAALHHATSVVAKVCGVSESHVSVI